MFLEGSPVLKWIVNIRDFGLEYAISRYYGLYGAEVVDVKDTKSQGRVRVKVGALGVGTIRSNGSFDPTDHPRRALATSIYAGPDHGVYFPPEPGDAVRVSFDHGDSEYPQCVGSWWRNKSPDGNPALSEVPDEFKMPKSGASPKRRGIKTSGGHGVIFSDEASMPYVAIWSGQQQTVGKSAFRNNQITLSDSQGMPNVKGMTDTSVKEGVYANTRYGHVLQLNDTDKKIVLSGLRVDPNALVANALIIEDLTGKVTVKTKTQQVVIDDITNTLTLTTPGIINLVAVGGISQAGGASPPTPAVPAGASVETGAGAKIITFIGAITQTAASFTQTAALTVFNSATTFVVNSPSVTLGIGGFGITIIGGAVIIGNIATARVLANDFLIDFVLNHEHPTAALGPPSKPTAGPISTIVNPGNPLPPITLAQYGSQTRVT